MPPGAQRQNRNSDQFRLAVMDELRRHDVAEAIIEFDGSGDEGQVQSISCKMLDGSIGTLDFPSSIPGEIIPAGTSIWDRGAGVYISHSSSRPATMAEILDEWSYELLSQIDGLWQDNLGSYGQIVIIPAANAIRCDQHRRFLDTETAHHEL